MFQILKNTLHGIYASCLSCMRHRYPAPAHIGVGAQSTLGEGIFVRKCA